MNKRLIPTVFCVAALFFSGCAKLRNFEMPQTPKEPEVVQPQVVSESAEAPSVEPAVDTSAVEPAVVAPVVPVAVQPVAPEPSIASDTTLAEIPFNANSSRLGKKDLEKLRSVANTLKADPALNVTVYTSADSRESSRNSIAIKRASAIFGAMERYGISAGRISVRSEGVKKAGNAKGRAQNRRAYIKVN